MPDNEKAPGFVDTNIWLYAFIEGETPEKTIKAKQIILDCEPIVSLQVVNEICVNLIKKAGFDEERIRQLIDAFYEKYEVIDLDQSTLLVAFQLRQKYALSFWDSLVIASALQAPVETLYSEDIQHGLIIEDSLKIINPLL